MLESLDYNPQTGKFIWKLSLSNRGIKGSFAGSLFSGYFHIRLYGKRYKAHRLAWFYVYGKMPDKHLDHIDNNPTNNKINNLRECNDQQNGRNRGLNSNNTSGYKGVSYIKSKNKYRAYCKIDGKYITLGSSFDTALEASNVYEKFAKEHFGEFYYSN